MLAALAEFERLLLVGLGQVGFNRHDAAERSSVLNSSSGLRKSRESGRWWRKESRWPRSPSCLGSTVAPSIAI